MSVERQREMDRTILVIVYCNYGNLILSIILFNLLYVHDEVGHHYPICMNKNQKSSCLLFFTSDN